MRVTEEQRSQFVTGGIRDNELLLEALAAIDVEGWDSPTATTLLQFVYDDLVRPLARALGMDSQDAVQAEATGWAIAWEVLANPGVRTADCPWAVVWTAVRRAVFGELLASRYGVSPSKAWAMWRRGCTGEHAWARAVCSWNELDGTDDEPIDTQGRLATTWSVDDINQELTDALTRAGWDPHGAARLVQRILEFADAGQGARVDKSGWRLIAAELGLPPWQVRRAMVAIFGAPGFTGLIERLARGEDLSGDELTTETLRATRVRGRRSPGFKAATQIAA